MPARVRSERTSLSNCANAASTPSINLPVDVSSIGSVADRSEMPSDCSSERSAKWSYLSRANRVRLKTTTKWTRPLLVRQNVSSFCSSRAVRGLRALALFLESRQDVEPFAAAVLLAGPELGRQAQVLRLLLGADANVDDGAGHGSQRSPLVWRLQGDCRASPRGQPRPLRCCSRNTSTSVCAIACTWRRMASTSSSDSSSASSASNSRQRSNREQAIRIVLFDQFVHGAGSS